jgi:hypothetical protein
MREKERGDNPSGDLPMLKATSRENKAMAEMSLLITAKQSMK